MVFCDMKIAVIAILAGLVVATHGHAADQSEAPATGLYIDLGVAGLLFNTSASVKAAGTSVPNAGIKASNNVTAGLGIGYFIIPELSVQALIGVPPTTTLTGTGALNALTLGKVTYGPGVLEIDYHFRRLGAFQPYIGTGMSYTIVFGTSDGAVRGLHVDNSLGAVLNAGIDVMLTPQWGAFLSVKKIFTATNATGIVSPAIPTLGGAPTSAHITFNPLVLFSGVTYRF